SGKCGNKHQQRRLRQMEVRQQRVNQTETESRQDVKIGFASACQDPAMFHHQVLQSSNSRRSDRYDPSFVRPRLLQCLCGDWRNFESLRTQNVFFDVVTPDWQEGSNTHV